MPKDLPSLEVREAWWAAYDYLHACVGVDAAAARTKAIADERLLRVRSALDMIQRADPQAYYVVMSLGQALTTGQALLTLLKLRVEHEAGVRDDPTDPVAEMIIPPEAFKEEP